MITEDSFLHERYLEPALNKTQSYRFTTKTTDFSNKNNAIEKDFVRNVEITYLGKNKDLLIFDVFTSNIVFKHNQTIVKEKILKEGALAFYDIELGVNDKGEIVKVFNRKEIENHWKQVKFEQKKINSGDELDDFFAAISDLLNNEEQVISFLNSRNMFGLFFHGLFAKPESDKIPQKRTTAIIEFDNIIVNVEIWMSKDAPQFLITAQKSDDANYIPNDNEIKKYIGEWIYNKNSQLEEVFFEIENQNLNIKYNVLWVG
ncbi:hypothetical protein [Flavobacterium bizetiae]|uniref:hypothetical protein n=1 Tax=Flavobacterium bizetiae TaxID=2704140 RepID=UPI0037565233